MGQLRQVRESLQIPPSAVQRVHEEVVVQLLRYLVSDGEFTPDEADVITSLMRALSVPAHVLLPDLIQWFHSAEAI